MSRLKRCAAVALALMMALTTSVALSEGEPEAYDSLLYDEIEELDAFELPLDGDAVEYDEDELILFEDQSTNVDEAGSAGDDVPAAADGGTSAPNDSQNADPDGGEPSSDDPVNGEPVNDDPSNGDPTAGESVNDDPSNGDPTAGEPVNDDPSNDNPSNDDPAAGDSHDEGTVDEGQQSDGSPEPEPDGDDAPDVPTEPSLRLEYAGLKLGLGERRRLRAEYISGEGYEPSETVQLAYSTSNKRVVAVSADGYIKGVRRGTATITVRAGSLSAACTVKVLKAPKSIKLNAKKAVMGYDAQLGLGTTFQIRAALTSKTASAISYAGYSTSVVSVDDNGLVTARGVGSTTVTAMTFNGKKAKISIVVQRAPDSVSLQPAELIICQGDTFAPSASIPEKTTSPLTYTSANPDCASVNPSTGVITAVQQGEAEVSAHTFNGLQAAMKVTVIGAPTELTLSDTHRTLGKGEGYALVATPLMDDQPLRCTVKFTSSNRKVATVDSGGYVKAKKKGSATITARTFNGKVATCKIKVVNAPKKISLNRKSAALGYDASLALGESFKLSAKLTKGTASAVRYLNYDSSVVLVDGAGVVTAVGVGRTTITARTFNGKKASCTVSVVPAPQSVAFGRETVCLGVGQRFAQKAVLPGGTASAISYSSTAPECASVDGGGTLTARAVGELDVEARAFNGVVGRYRVTVVPAPTSMTVSPGALSIGVGEKNARLFATFDVGILDGSCSFKSANARIARVSGSGVVSGVKKGKTTIKVTAYNGKLTRSVPVTVYAAPKSVSLSARQLTLDLNQTAQLTASCPKGQRSAFSFASSDTGVATVDESGVVTGVGTGSAQITVSTFNNKRASCEVRVIEPAAEIRMPDGASLVSTIFQDFPIEVCDAAGAPYEGARTVSFQPEGIAVYRDGRLVGRRGGSTVMTVRASGIERSCEVSVTSYRSVRPAMSIAHRGASGYYPENTLAAFENAAGLGADGVELDVHTTLDGVQVVHHDSKFTVKKKEYVIAKCTYAKLKSAKPGLCTLDEAIEVIDAAGLRLFLELKSTADGAKCVRIVRDHGMEDRTVYISFSDSALRQVRAADPSARLGKTLNSALSNAAVRSLRDELRLSMLMVNYSVITPENLEDWRDMGLEISAWTVNNRNEVARMCEMGVDYVLSDYPDYCAGMR